MGIGPPTSAQLQVVLARPPPRLLACLGMSQLRDKSRLKVDSKSCEHVAQNLPGMAFPSYHWGSIYILTRRIFVRCSISSNHNGQQQCHQKSLLPPCHRARSQPASHSKKACYGCGAPRNSTTPTHVSMSDVVPQPGTWVRACLPRSPPLYFSRLFHVRCPCFQATMTNSATTTDNMLAVWTVTVYINQDTTITQVVR